MAETEVSVQRMYGLRDGSRDRRIREGQAARGNKEKGYRKRSETPEAGMEKNQ